MPQHMFVQLYCVVGQRLRDWCRTLVCQTSQKHLLLYMQSSLVAVQIEHLSSQLNKILLAMAVSLGSCSCASGHLAAISVSECDLLDECMNVLLHALLIVTPRYCCRIFWKLCTTALWTLTRVILKMILLLFSNCLQMLISLHIHCLQVLVNKLQSWIVGCVQTLASYSKKYMLCSLR